MINPRTPFARPRSSVGRRPPQGSARSAPAEPTDPYQTDRPLPARLEGADDDGVADNFARWLTEHNVDARLPLVADYCGAMINTSIQAVDAAAGTVRCYAPVFPQIKYRVAAPIGDYPTEFARAVERTNVEPTFACNCILNHLYGDLEGRRTGEVTGPITFGEIAYHLVNQTVVYLSVEAV